MELEKFLASIIFFVFSVFLFIEMQNTIPSAALTDDVASVVMVFPTLFIVIMAFSSIYFGLKK